MEKPARVRDALGAFFSPTRFNNAYKHAVVLAVDGASEARTLIHVAA
ncbi:MAG: hypothetical protein ABJC89_16535 [Acidobacteriota bacterium]